MVPALTRYISAIEMLGNIFTELARDTDNIGRKLDKIKENDKSEDSKKAKSLFDKMKKVSKGLDA